MGKLLTEKQVAERLGFHVQTLRNHRFEGRGVPYCKIGRAVRYDENDVIAFIEASKVQPAER
ncbi:hypothetical protein DSCO28_71870 [Desulfosarcina ovata subsp. sediminis]|uniref:Helix-turn-helix domain-containing protein n=1 Tax=Desulfosarcina ovata subsp. sediminis TaxID=885957 RepID=A0A5K8A2E9_9BACT|nr:helix-turn-helix domain-containing protein [Desulfosarcina ovata]BBO86621.1 hypothetical protein DSCO28_71870 [Desulfosarcina ovata subsp. sediminis]